MEQRVSIIGLGVRDLPAARAFYLDGLGLRASGASNEEIIFIQVGGIALSLYSRDKLAEDVEVDPAGEGFAGITIAYTARSRVEVDQVLRQAEVAGGRLVKAAQDVFWGGYSGYFADPDGHLWEVAWNPFLEIDAAGNLLLPD